MVENNTTPQAAAHIDTSAFDARVNEGFIARVNAVGDMILGALVDRLQAMGGAIAEKAGQMGASISSGMGRMKENMSFSAFPGGSKPEKSDPSPSQARTPEIAQSIPHEVGHSAKMAVMHVNSTQMAHIESVTGHGGVSPIGLTVQPAQAASRGV